jgi:hypothetical protein
MSREITTEECRVQFVNHMIGLIKHFDDGRILSIRDMETMVHSFLVTLDGGAMGLPAFQVIPYPHESDKDYCIEQGENYFPQSQPMSTDISGGLHDLFNSIRR